MAEKLIQYADIFGADFNEVVDTIQESLPGNVQGLLSNTLDSMKYDVDRFSASINKSVSTMRARGLSESSIQANLTKDMRAGRGAFGELKNSIKESTAQAINQTSRLGQISEYNEFTNFMWVTVAGHKVCFDCAERSGAILTYEEWEGEGLPGTGWSVCKGYCYCILDPIGKMGKSVDAPVEPEYNKTLRKDTDAKALSMSKLNKDQLKIYKDTMNLDGKRAKAMLARKNMTKEQALKGLTEHRAKLQNAGKDSKQLNFVKRGEVRALDRYGKPILKEDGTYKMLEVGDYPRERAIMHNRIARGIVDRGKVAAAKEAPDVLMTGGYPGSGKSTMLNKQFKGWQDKYVHIDSDAVKAILAKLDDTDLTWNAGMYHEEADDILSLVFQKSFNQRKHVLFDGTMKATNKMVDFIDWYHGTGGYNPVMAFSDIPMEETLIRATARALGDGGVATGRFVEPSYIVTHLNRNISTYNTLKDKFEDIIKYVKYNNDVPPGDPPIWMESNC